MMKYNYINEYKKWLANCNDDFDLKPQLIAYNEDEIKESFYDELTFGTAGMRGIIGAGTNKMNIYTLRRANYGYGQFLKNKYHENISVVIACDNRIYSKEFADECVKVLSTFGIKCYIFEDIMPTPVLSFAIRYLNANGGIVITASHNSKEYNGYKIYDDNGCQLIPELASEVINNMNYCPDYFEIKVNDLDYCKKNNLLEFVSEEVVDNYINLITNLSTIKNIKKNDFTIIFSPLHGTTTKIATNILKKLNYCYVAVEEQCNNDPLFSTVEFPNPEDHNALSLSIKYAKKYNADICFATDPDGDRIGVSVKNNDDYVLLNGNQIGVIIFDYLCKTKNVEDSYVIDTIVSTRLIDKIAKKHSVNHLSTFTGFKFISSQIEHLTKHNKKFLFGFEESYGYLIDSNVRDKDALQAMVILSEIAYYYKQKNLNLLEVLDSIYLEYGFSNEELISITLNGINGSNKIDRIIKYFRDYSHLHLGNFKIINKIDYSLTDLIINNINLGRSNIIQFDFDNLYVIFRPSGTEPKLKAYIGSYANNRNQCLKQLEEFKQCVNNIIKELI